MWRGELFNYDCDLKWQIIFAPSSDQVLIPSFNSHLLRLPRSLQTSSFHSYEPFQYRYGNHDSDLYGCGEAEVGGSEPTSR